MAPNIGDVSTFADPEWESSAPSNLVLAGLDPTVWVAPAPTTLIEAINRIAAAVSSINGGEPIQ